MKSVQAIVDTIIIVHEVYNNLEHTLAQYSLQSKILTTLFVT